MDVALFRKLDEFFTRFTTAINEAVTEEQFRQAAHLFDAAEFDELSAESQNELRDHYAHRHARRMKV